MALKHTDIWRAIDALAKRHGLSASGLARKAGLSPTVFNPSKRVSAARKRWPSTESIAQILQATNTTLDDFVTLASPQTAVLRTVLPLLGYAEAGRQGFFDDAGYPTMIGWDEVRFPGVSDPHAFALEVNGKSMEPVYREGDRLIISPAEKCKRGDRVVVRTKKGEVMVKQLGRETLQKMDLISLNSSFPVVSLSTKDIEWVYRIIFVTQ